MKVKTLSINILKHGKKNYQVEFEWFEEPLDPATEGFIPFAAEMFAKAVIHMKSSKAPRL